MQCYTVIICLEVHNIHEVVVFRLKSVNIYTLRKIQYLYEKRNYI